MSGLRINDRKSQEGQLEAIQTIVSLSEFKYNTLKMLTMSNQFPECCNYAVGVAAAQIYNFWKKYEFGHIYDWPGIRIMCGSVVDGTTRFMHWWLETNFEAIIDFTAIQFPWIGKRLLYPDLEGLYENSDGTFNHSFLQDIRNLVTIKPEALYSIFPNGVIVADNPAHDCYLDGTQV